MATKNSGDLAPGTSYTLGNYTLRTGSAYDSQTGKTDIVAYCRLEGEGPAKQGVKHISIDGEATIKSWSVDANEDTADVYVMLDVEKSRLTEGILVYVELPAGRTDTGLVNNIHYYIDTQDPGFKYTLVGGLKYAIAAMDRPREASLSYGWYGPGGAGSSTGERQFTHNGLTVYYSYWEYNWYTYVAPGSDAMNLGVIPTSYVIPNNKLEWIAWDLVYGLGEEQEKTHLVARFAIDLHEAGGTGSESDWDDPGDWNEDPSTVLNLTVEGALSGRHNDYLFDPTFSYTPAENEAKADYGCGGNGGHGGGGGAGASTVVIRDFATNRANRVQDVAIAKRHGYGSGGGKGAQGGPGCILIYY